ncbi:protein of unassigned function [Methylobacterium oryzae CBMB20]|uniref:Protein of unassigned function n=1 Tax=Methylobacterium oryzae CBMB20 TaxID=693986 RepID=A0A089NS58_9HYPH|nr:protein of unassigned function [Methylobacterium oryzae CBMB20]
MFGIGWLCAVARGDAGAFDPRDTKDAVNLRFGVVDPDAGLRAGKARGPSPTRAPSS